MNRIAALLVLIGLFGSGRSIAEDLGEWLRKANSADPTQRRSAYEVLSSSNVKGRAQLAVLLDRKLRQAKSSLARALPMPAVNAALATAGKELQKARDEALPLINSETEYPEGRPGDAAQKKVVAAVEDVERAFAGLREAVLNVPAVSNAFEETCEFADALLRLQRPQCGGYQRCFEGEALLDATVDPEANAALPILAANRFAPSSESHIERVLLAQVNAYRLKLGLPVLRFDARLHRAASWFARHAQENDLRGHFCNVKGRKDPLERAGAEGHSRCTGECMAFNGTHLEDWIHSASHHRVLVDKQPRQGAVAVYQNVAVLVTGLEWPAKERAAVVSMEQRQVWEDLFRALSPRPQREQKRRLVRLASFLTSKGRKKLAEQAWDAVLRLDPGHADAHAALGNVRQADRWVYRKETDRKRDLRWVKNLRAWRETLKKPDVATRGSALVEIGRAGATELTGEVRALLSGTNPELLSSALLAAAWLRIPAGKEKALTLLKSPQKHTRAAAAAALEIWGGADVVDALIQGLGRMLSEYAFIRAVEAITGHRTGMHFGDNRAQRTAKVKALQEWWVRERANY